MHSSCYGKSKENRIYVRFFKISMIELSNKTINYKKTHLHWNLCTNTGIFNLKHPSLFYSQSTYYILRMNEKGLTIERANNKNQKV